MSFPRFLAPVVLALAMTIPVPAEGATVTFRDPAKDAPARYDLTRIKVSNEARVVSAVARVRSLRRGRTQIVGMHVTPRRGNATYFAQTVRRRNGQVVGKLIRYDDDGVSVVCRVRSRWLIGKNKVALRFRRSCISAPGKLRVFLAMGAGNGSAGDPADWTRTVGVPFK